MERFPDTNAFIQVLEETSKRNGERKISRLWLKTGPGMSFGGGISEYIEAILRGTAARGAEILISRGNAARKCRCCGLVYGDEDKAHCPACGGVTERISLERSFIIDKVELQNI